MKRAARYVAILLAGAAPAGLRAGESPGQVQQRADPAAPAPDPGQEVEFIGPDGEPLSPERQREAQELLKKDSLPLPAPAPPPGPIREEPVRRGGNEIVVTGQKPRASVIGDIPPAQTFNPLDIRAFGASNIGELLQTLESQISSGRGREDTGPVVLLNGKRVSSFTEIAQIPTEAIERMEVFPEELAVKYGYRADQKVVNIVTYERFSSRIGQVSYAVPTEGGRDTLGLNGNVLHITRDTRINVDADYARSGALLESERGVRQAVGAPEASRFRTLLPQTQRAAVNGTVSGEWLNGVSSTFNGRLEVNESGSLLGRGGGGALARDIDTRSLHLGTAQGGPAGKWLWSFTANYDRTTTETSTDTAVGARDEARAVNALADADLVLSGPLAALPAGPIAASLRAGGEMRDFVGRSLRAGVEQSTHLSRDRIGAQASFDLPIASRRTGILPWLGDLSANVNVAVDHLSDFGTLTTIGYGLTWTPRAGFNVIASATNEEGAPTVEQLGAPLVVTPNVRTFDFTRREVVEVTRLFGGNPALRPDDRQVLKLGLNAKPFPKTDLTFSIDYIKTRIDDPIAAFPIATPLIEAAFPGRFTRGSDGRLQRIDATPLNFERSDQERLRWGVNFTRPLGAVPPGMQNARVRFVGSGSDLQSALPPGARIIKAEPGSAAARRFENVSSRLTLSLYYTLNLVDQIVTREGGPVLDLLDGAAIEARGGRARHEIEFQATAFKKGLGARLKLNWQSGTVVRSLSASAADRSGDLSFAGFAMVNLNLFANLADRFGGEAAPAWLKGLRASVGINNLFNQRPRVRDNAGLTPLSYQPAYLDPLGRSVNFSLRKLF